MSAANAKETAELWVALKALPAELRGRTVQLVIFANEDDCRFFYPRRALPWQVMVNTCIRKILHGRHAKITRVTLTPEMYHEWRGHREDSEDARREFADSFAKLLD